jgi:hypothetical protein
MPHRMHRGASELQADATWRPPSPPLSIASFAAPTVDQFDSVSQAGWRPPRQHPHHAHHHHRSSGISPQPYLLPYRPVRESRSAESLKLTEANLLMYTAKPQTPIFTQTPPKPEIEVSERRSQSRERAGDSPSHHTHERRHRRHHRERSEDSTMLSPHHHHRKSRSHSRSRSSRHVSSEALNDASIPFESQQTPHSPRERSGHRREHRKHKHSHSTLIPSKNESDVVVVEVEEAESDSDGPHYHLKRTHQYHVHNES